MSTSGTVVGDERGESRVFDTSGVDHDVRVGQGPTQGLGTGLVQVDHSVGTGGVPASGDCDIAGGPQLRDDPGPDLAVPPEDQDLHRTDSWSRGERRLDRDCATTTPHTRP